MSAFTLSSAWIQFWPNYTLRFIFGYLIVSYVICKYFLPLCGLPLCFLNAVLCTEFFILMKSSVWFFFSFAACTFAIFKDGDLYLLVGYGYYSYYLLCLKSCMDQHVINLRVFWPIESFLHILSCNSSTRPGKNSLLPPLQKITGEVPESARIRANVLKVLN